MIFDDFTTASKYVDFPFKVKSSAIKILSASTECNLRFMYELLQIIDLPKGDHKRYYISECQKKIVKIPTLKEQEAIVKIIICIDNLIELHEKELKFRKVQKKSIMNQLLNGIFRVKCD